MDCTHYTLCLSLYYRHCQFEWKCCTWCEYFSSHLIIFGQGGCYYLLFSTSHLLYLLHGKCLPALTIHNSEHTHTLYRKLSQRRISFSFFSFNLFLLLALHTLCYFVSLDGMAWMAMEPPFTE